MTSVRTRTLRHAGLAPRLVRDVCVNASLSFRTVERLRDERRLRRGYDQTKDDPAYPLTVFAQHRAAIAGDGIRGRKILEIGPGGNYGVAFLFLLSGAAHATCVDVVDWGSSLAPSFYAALAGRHLGDPDGSAAAADVLRRLDVVVPADVHALPFADGAFDYVYSQACFEHFARPRDAIREIARVLKPGGLTSHQVDLRDHRSFERPLDFLHYSSPVWHVATSRRTCFTNRMRASAYMEAFTTAGLDVLRLDVTERTAVTATDREAFAQDFRRSSLSDLETTGIFIVATRSGAPAPDDDGIG